ncbi:MAG: hypothetical protein OJJ55_18685 [Rhodococcus sp.]|nr:hypothetical protein [Rhodococcus sp. (in: high G+C Gram-positive bacteria)]
MSVLGDEGEVDEPISKLGRIIELTAQHGTEEAHMLATWLYRAAMDHVENGKRFDFALGLGGSPSRSARFEVLRRRRNAYLTVALDALGGDFDELAREVGLYLERVPAHLRDRRQPDDWWTPQRCAIHRARFTGLELPQSVKGLRNALRK